MISNSTQSAAATQIPPSARPLPAARRPELGDAPSSATNVRQTRAGQPQSLAPLPSSPPAHPPPRGSLLNLSV